MSELPGVLAIAADNTAGVFGLSADTLAVLFFALQFVENYENWKDYADEVLSDADRDDIDRLVGVATYEVMNMVDIIPIGQIMLYGSLTPIPGWLSCNGQTVNRADYPALFDVIGESFGAGDGSTTFQLPDFEDWIPMGAGGAVVPDVGNTAGALTHTLTTAEIPAHSHTLSDPGHIHGINTATGGAAGANNVIVAGVANVNTAPTVKNSNSNTTGISINNAGGGGSHSILNPVVGVAYFIYSGVS